MNRNLYIILLLISVFGFRLKSSAQFSSAQKEAISTIDYFELEYEPRKPKFLKLGKNPIVNYNPITLTFGGALFLYQKVISPQLQSRCPYEISCSAFSFASIQEYGLLKGVALSADRLTRCTQFTTIDMLPSQMNDRTGMLIDNPSKYSVKGDHTGHDHK
jgi:putative component of membrane protein insertase Oxa1/YidC/SpoIIIJ protein YidD